MRRLIPLVLLVAIPLAGGCNTKSREVGKAEPPVVPVAHPYKGEVTDYVEFTGRTNAIESVNIVPRVTGYLTKMPFKEGAEVKAGELLFEIDPRPYQAQLDQAEGQVNLYQAQFKLAEITLSRDRQAGSAVSPLQLDQDAASVSEARARLNAAKSSTEVYKLNLEFTKVLSPIDGQVSRRFLTVGNLVNQDQTLLTTVVSLDPIYVYFDMDEQTLKGIRDAVNDGRIKTPKDGKLPVQMALPGETNYPRTGTIDFVNNQVNPNTGSISVRGKFPNPKPENGVRVMSPGMFVRIRMPIGEKHMALEVIDRSITSDQGSKYVYVVGNDNKVTSKQIKTGSLQEDGRRVVTEGLKGDEWVVSGAIQQVRPGMVVQKEILAQMPSFRQQAADQAENKEKAAPVEKKAK
ncbi:MAG TPA: efflux RND transporter periplasmic adaptor subunit [Gemmataceae bacterium]|nr:efflux RND transporter periplasmic adaptor subunit [Gemmataceae bacterium]